MADAMDSDGPAEVVFPRSAGGRRSTSAAGRAVVADALRQVDSAGAVAAEQERDWRTGYLVHFRRLVEAGLTSKDAAVSVARDGLESLHQTMQIVSADGEEAGLDGLLRAPAQRLPATVTVSGTGKAVNELSLRITARNCAGTPWCAGWKRGWPMASSSRHVRTRSPRSRRIRSGCACPAARSRCSGRARRWVPFLCCWLGRPGDRH